MCPFHSMMIKIWETLWEGVGRMNPMDGPRILWKLYHYLLALISISNSNGRITESSNSIVKENGVLFIWELTKDRLCSTGPATLGSAVLLRVLTTWWATWIVHDIIRAESPVHTKWTVEKHIRKTLLPLKKNFHLIISLWKLNTWQWAAKLPCYLKHQDRTDAHKVIKVVSHSSHWSLNESGINVPKRSWVHK